MMKHLSILFSSGLCCATVVLGLLVASVSASAKEGSDAREASMPEKHFAIFDKYCLECHDALTEKGEVNLEDLSFSLIEDIQTAELWNKVLNSINSGEMPPEDKKPIADDEKTEFLRDLSEMMVQARSILSDSGGVVTLRRLNRREYANTLEELIGIRPDTSLLPDDQASSEFDTMGASLFFSSDQLEQYLKTAENALELALFSKPQAMPKTHRIEPEEVYYPIYAKLAEERLEAAQQYYRWRAAGGTDDIAKEYGFLDGWQADRRINNFRESYLPLEKWLLAPENKMGTSLMITIKSSFTQVKFPQIRGWESGRYRIRVRAGVYEDDPVRFRYLEFSRRDGQNATRLGWRKVTSSLRKPEIIEFEIDHEPGMDAAYWVQKRTHMDRGDKNLEAEYRKANGHGTPWGIWIDWAEIEGPLSVEGEPVLAGGLLHDPPKGQDENDYAKEVIRRFAETAFRGEVPVEEYLDKLYGRYRANRTKGQDLKEALIGPLAIVLSSPVSFTWWKGRRAQGLKG